MKNTKRSFYESRAAAARMAASSVSEEKGQSANRPPVSTASSSGKSVVNVQPRGTPDDAMRTSAVPFGMDVDSTAQEIQQYSWPMPATTGGSEVVDTKGKSTYAQLTKKA